MFTKEIIQRTDSCGLMDERRDSSVLISALDETSATVNSFEAQNCNDKRSSKAQVVIASDEIDCKETTTINGEQAYQEFDSDEDFFSVVGEFTPSCSNSSSRQWSFEASPQLQKICDSKETFLQEPFSRDDDQENVLPVCKEVKLAKFFQDRHWKEEIASTDSSLPIASVIKENGIHDLPQNRISSMPRKNIMINHEKGNSDLKSKNNDMDNYCCMPSWSPRRGSKEKRKSRRTRV